MKGVGGGEDRWGDSHWPVISQSLFSSLDFKTSHGLSQAVFLPVGYQSHYNSQGLLPPQRLVQNTPRAPALSPFACASEYVPKGQNSSLDEPNLFRACKPG